MINISNVLLTTKVAFYARSSNDGHDVSCESQLRGFQELADKAGEIVVEKREDSAISHFDAVGFMELINELKQHPDAFSKVYVHDTHVLAVTRLSKLC